MTRLSSYLTLATTCLLFANSAFAANNVGPGGGGGSSGPGGGGGSGGGSGGGNSVLRVPVPYLTIQAAIDAASDGDQILVSPLGTYRGSGDSVIDTKGKALWIKALTDEFSGPVTIDGEGVRRCVVCDSGEGSDTIIEGFRIINGSTSGNGAGVYCSGSSPTFERCTFRYNAAENKGGGFHSSNGNPTLTRCVFENNQAWGSGGGISLSGGVIHLADCEFEHNLSNSNGGGVYVTSSTVVLADCLLEDNWSTAGSGMAASNSTVTLTDSSFNENGADYGGAFSIDGSSSVFVSGCVFNSNDAVHVAGGISNSEASVLTVVDTEFVDNSCAYEGGAILNTGELHMVGCSLSNNTVSDGKGGGVYTVTSIGGPVSSITDSVITENSAAVSGGGFHVEGSASGGLELVGSSICGNSGGQVAGLYTDLGGNWIAEMCGSQSPSDVNNDGAVDGHDLAAVLGAWGSENTVADIDQDGIVGGADLTLLLGAWN